MNPVKPFVKKGNGMEPTGYLETQTIAPNSGVSFEENFTKYEEASNVNASQVILKIGVFVAEGAGKKEVRVGSILLLQGTSPNPSVCFKNLKNDLGIELRIKRSRFGGGGPRTIEVVRTADR